MADGMDVDTDADIIKKSNKSKPRHIFGLIKRRNPFGEDRHHMKSTNSQAVSGFEATFELMQQNSTVSKMCTDIAKKEQTTGSTPTCLCHICRANSGRIPCAFCTRLGCVNCAKRCEGCEGTFCAFCRTTNYDLRWDRELCFACNSATN